MKPLLLVILVAVAVYTYSKTNFWGAYGKGHSDSQQWWYAAGMQPGDQFYDGFVGQRAGASSYSLL